tara:strand:- start:3000 stop:3563 length:564 start_codon:yes stop_codon:yes gene_type:complete
MTQFIAPPTSPIALLVLSLLSTGGQHHEKDIESFAHTNRASHFVSVLRKDGWEIQTIKGKQGEGSSYMMTNPDQCDRAQTFDITSALVTMENPPAEAPTFEDYQLTSTVIASQLSLFTPSNLTRDNRFDVAEMIAAAVDILRKGQIEILSGRPTITELKAQGKLAKALEMVMGAIDILNGKEKPEQF